MSAAVEVEILGDGSFAGAASNIITYTVSEYSSPVAMSDLAAGVGGISFDVIDDPSFDGSALLLSQPFKLSDPRAGVQNGVIDDASVRDDAIMNVEASGLLVPLVAEVSIPSHNGTLSTALNLHMSICGVTAPMQIDPDLALVAVTLPPWTGDVWTRVKRLAAIYKFEIADVAGTVVVRKLRLRTIDTERYTSSALRYAQGSAYHSVEVFYYNNQWKTNTAVFPIANTPIEKRQVISVNAGETSVTNLAVNMWLQSIMPSTVTTSVPVDTAGNVSVYSVIDKDGNTVAPSEWTDAGGSIKFAIAEDRKSIDATVTGASIADRAPFRIANPILDEEDPVPSLYIAATGVAFDRKVITSETGANSADAPVDDILTIDDELISTRQQAQEVLSILALRSTGFDQSLEASATSVNRRGEVGQIVYPTFGEFDATLPVGYTFANFNTAHAGETFAFFTSAQGDLVRDDFENQAFGGVAGARVRHRSAMYRVRDARISTSGVDFKAENDTLFSDWEETFGSTLALSATNLVPDSQAVTGNSHALYSSSTEEVGGGVITVTIGVNNPASLVGMIYPIPVPESSPFSARFQIRRKPGMAVARGIIIRPTAYLAGGGVPWTTVGDQGSALSLPNVGDSWVDVEFSNYVQAATGKDVGLQIYMASAQIGDGYQIRNVIASPTPVAPQFFAVPSPDQTTVANWTGVANASPSELYVPTGPRPTFGSFNDTWAGKTFEQHARMPLHA